MMQSRVRIILWIGGARGLGDGLPAYLEDKPCCITELCGSPIAESQRCLGTADGAGQE